MFVFRNIVVIFTILILLGVGVYLFKNNPPTANLNSKPSSVTYDAGGEKYSFDIQTIASGLEVPWDFALDGDRLFFTERPGRLKVLENGQTIAIATLPQVVSVGESGLTGMALHPDFAQNGYVYLYYTYRNAGQILNRVSRFTLKGNNLQDEKVILDNLAGGSIHNGGRLRFGPDNKLWVLTGDGAKPSLAQDINSLAGKVLRMNDDGSVPADNPIKKSLVYSFGHRNPQGLAWHPETKGTFSSSKQSFSSSKELLVTEHGETSHDEINIIKPNSNYGWPEVKKCFSDDPRFVNPILCSGEETYAPSGIASFGTSISRFKNSFVFAGLRGNLLERIEVVGGKVGEREVIIKGTYGRLRAVLIDKDGNIYVGTSNKDGRGNPTGEDDRILKITPIAF